MKKTIIITFLMLLPMLASANDNQQESLYGEWQLVGWNDGGIRFEVDTNYVSHKHMSIEIPKEGYVKAYSMVNEIFLGLLTLNGNEMVFGGESRRLSTEVYCDIKENLFFENHICDIKLYHFDGNMLKLYYTDTDYFVFTSFINNSEDMQAQEKPSDYHPLVEEGKHWTYDNYMPERPAKYNHYYYYDLKGDTLIAGKNSLKMFSDNSNNDGIVRYVGALYEENKKVYCFYPEKEEAVLLYDFDCEVGDTIHVKAGNMVVKDIQTEDNGGIPIKKYTFQNNVIWIEGVGAMMDFFAMVPFMGNYNSLNACELNGEKLYHTVAPKTIMVTEGKRWNYIHYYIDEDGEHRDPYSYVVKGDTIINRTFYKKLWYQDEKTEKLVCVLLEAGHEIFKKYDNSYLRSFFDFGREDFGRVFTWKAELNGGNTNWMVYGVDTIEVNNRPFRRYTCLQKYSKENEKLTTIEYDGKGVWHDIWVEGVGSASSGIEDQNPLHEPPVKTTSDYTYFVSCYENGECIFTADDFNIQPTPKPDINMAYYYYYEGNKIPLTLNENKVVVSIPKDCGEITERFRANVQTQASIRDDIYDIYVITRTEYEKLTLLDFWAEDAKSIILTSSYFTESNEEVFATPYLNVRLKKEEDIDLLTSYAEQYKLTIVRNSPLMPLWYILAVTLESEKSPLECANELYESGNFVSSVPDLVDVIIPETAYRPFVEEGKVWAVKVISDWWPTEEWFEYYYFDGDTIVNGQKAKRMLFDRIGTSQDTYGEYVGAWFEQDKKVYYAANGKQQFELIYDFTLSTGDNLQSLEGILQVTKMSGCIPGFKGTYYDLQYSYDTNIVERWLEGVGSESYPWLNLRGEWAGNRGDLLFCIVGDEIIYYNSEEGDPYIMGAKKRFDFTHTIKIDPKAPMKREAEQSLYGEYNNQQLGINLNSLEDAYLVRITDKTGKVVYEKDINAGNIVGLNINISTYGDGRYTVTMENNHESFTGEFEVQTSGIEEVRNNHEMIKGYIYNLQGQRISTLQKGLNIVNGRKIYVK